MIGLQYNEYKTPRSLDGGNYIQGLHLYFPNWYDSSHVNKWVDEEHDRNRLITSQWCKLLTSVRETTSNVNVSQSTQHNPWDVNEWVGVEHFMESFDRQSMMKTDVQGEKPAIDACRFQGTDDF